MIAQNYQEIQMTRYHWELVDDFGNIVNLDCDYGSLTIDAACDFLQDGKQ